MGCGMWDRWQEGSQWGPIRDEWDGIWDVGCGGGDVGWLGEGGSNGVLYGIGGMRYGNMGCEMTDMGYGVC